MCLERKASWCFNFTTKSRAVATICVTHLQSGVDMQTHSLHVHACRKSYFRHNFSETASRMVALMLSSKSLIRRNHVYPPTVTLRRIIYRLKLETPYPRTFSARTPAIRLPTFSANHHTDVHVRTPKRLPS